MRKNDYLIAAGLLFLAVFIWIRDLAWVTSSDDTLPILISLPLFVWLGMPWKWSSAPPEYSKNLLVAGVLFFCVGIGLNVTILLTIGWVALLSLWMQARLQKETLPHFYKLLVLPFMAFPWVSLDFDSLGWWFRLSGAWVAENIFSWAGFDVSREGTLLKINGLLISIEVACAGLNTLQSMLISGAVAAYLILGRTIYYWFAFPFIFFMAWVANTIRILVICAIGLLISPAFIMGPFHIWVGWFVLILMFGICWLSLSLLEPKEEK